MNHPHARGLAALLPPVAAQAPFGAARQET